MAKTLNTVTWRGVLDKVTQSGKNAVEAVKGAGTGTFVAGGKAGSAVNTVALHGADAAASVLHGTSKIAKSGPGKAAIAIAALTAAVAGIGSWYHKREARKNAATAELQSDETQTLQQQLAANKARMAEVSAELGANNRVSGNLADGIMNGRGMSQGLPNLSQPNPQ